MKILPIIILIALLAFGCIGSETNQSGYSKSAIAPTPYDMEDSASYGGEYVTKESYIKVKVSGELDDQFEKLKDQLSSDSAKVSDINYNEYGDQIQYSVTIKVLPSKFDSTIDMIKEYGEVKDLSVSLEDVTKQYTDLDTRISNKENELARLNQLYNKSETVSEIIEVERELTRVETELEMLKWQKQDLESRISRSTIRLTLYEDKPATQSLSLSLENLAVMFFGAIAAAITIIVIGIGFLIPVAIVIGLLFLIYKAVRHRKPSASRNQPR